MKKIFYLLLILILSACGSQTANISSDSSKQTSNAKISAQSIISQMEKGRYAEGELLVKFKSGVVSSSSLKAHQAVGASVARKFSIVPNLERVKLPQGLSVKDAIVRYMSDPDVEYAEPNYIRHTSTLVPTDIIPSQILPNDQYFGQQWALRNIGQFTGGTAGADIKATAAWDISSGSSIVIAVLDSGIDYNHPDLVANIWTNPGETSCTDGIDNDNNGFIDDCKGWDFSTCAKFDENGLCITTKTADNNPMDDYGHGTHVAGIIGAVGNNNLGVAGVMWTTQLMAVKFLNADGEGSIADEIEGIEYAVANGAKIINTSFGGSEFSVSERDAISSANAVHVLVMAAAGNDGTNNDFTPFFPASYTAPTFGGLPNIISVASTNQNDVRSSFSNFGLNSVHVAGPGEYILSTVPLGLTLSFCTASSSAGYDFCSGASMSTAYVSGLAGLLYSYYTDPDFTYSKIRGTILRYVDPLPTLSGWIQRGGRIDAFWALSSLLTPTNLTANATSSSQISLAWTDNATGEDGYKVETRTSGGSFDPNNPAKLPANSQSFTHSGLIDGTTYFYRVRAYNSLPNPPGAAWIEADSFYSDERSATTPLNPPAGLTAVALSSTQVNLAWSETSQTEEGFAIERGSDGNFAQIAVVGPNAVTYSDSGLSPATKYTYRVRAFNTAAGNSAYSNEATVTTLTTGGSPVTSGGGGGCSIGARQNTPTVVADLAVMLIPLMVILVMRRRR